MIGHGIPPQLTLFVHGISRQAAREACATARKNESSPLREVAFRPDASCCCFTSTAPGETIIARGAHVYVVTLTLGSSAE
ncbi:hypothetical protein BC2230_140068 [Burkholderia cepacia]